MKRRGWSGSFMVFYGFLGCCSMLFVFLGFLKDLLVLISEISRKPMFYDRPTGKTGLFFI